MNQPKRSRAFAGLVVAAIMLAAATSGCEGLAGPPGEPGPVGEPGPDAGFESELLEVQLSGLPVVYESGPETRENSECYPGIYRFVSLRGAVPVAALRETVVEDGIFLVYLHDTRQEKWVPLNERTELSERHQEFDEPPPIFRYAQLNVYWDAVPDSLRLTMYFNSGTCFMVGVDSTTVAEQGHLIGMDAFSPLRIRVVASEANPLPESRRERRRAR